jgi:cell division protease FtsH
MVNQLLTEMDGFRKEKPCSSSAPRTSSSRRRRADAPGQFEFALHIPYPNEEDRRAIQRSTTNGSAAT